MNPDYLLLGHFTRDVLPDGTTAPGGTSLYASFAAQRLGRRVAVVSAPSELPPELQESIAVTFHASPAPPTFENQYTPQGRRQILHATSEPIALEDIPAEWRLAPIVHLGPVLGETPEQLVHAFPGALLGVTPQGWMRSWGTNLPDLISYRPWRPGADLLRRIDALILSIEDVKGDEALVAGYARHCPLVALTRGASGATLFIAGLPYQVDAFPAVERDPTGAGDVFAAALLIRLHETGDALEAARFAACVAAGSVEGRGASQIPTREETARRLGAMIEDQHKTMSDER
jgi:sugar/nucleoside kinase (ribokinase family)